MWYYLLYVVLVVTPHTSTTVEGEAYLLEKYDTADECDRERDRIGAEMAVSYPDEHDFMIVCRPSASAHAAPPRREDGETWPH